MIPYSRRRWLRDCFLNLYRRDLERWDPCVQRVSSDLCLKGGDGTHCVGVFLGRCLAL
jgi:hypothetical protein